MLEAPPLLLSPLINSQLLHFARSAQASAGGLLPAINSCLTGTC